MRTLLLGSTVLPLLAATLSAQIDFDPALSLSVGTRPDGAALGDFDGDGDVDVAATADAPDRVVILSQNAGAFTQTGAVATGNGTNPHRLVAADLDGDGDVDLAVTLQNVDQVRTLLNDGFGNFSNGTSVATGTEPRDLVVGDLDGDGDADLAAANRDGNSVTVLTNSGVGTFTTQTVATGAEPRELAIGDLDGDGDVDLATSAHDDRRVDVLTNQGGSFAVTQSVPFFNPFRPDGLTAADVDGDGDVDLVGTSSDDQIAGQNVASVMLNTAGTFASPVHFATGGLDSSAIEAADLDGDGDVDLLVANRVSNDVSALAGTGTGSFGAPTLFAVGAEPGDVVLGDVDGDGAIDAVTPNEASGDVSLLLNRADGGVVASITSRNGSGVNPSVLSALTLPIVGTTFTARIDAASVGVGGGLTVLVAYAAPLAGVNTAYGELLVDPTSAFLAASSALVSGGVADHSNAIPASVALLGTTFSAQSWIGQIRQLTNALDGVIGDR